MGLFGRRKAMVAEMATLQGEVGALREWLADVESERAGLRAQLARLDSEATTDRAGVEERLGGFAQRFEGVTSGHGERVGDLEGRLEKLEMRVDRLPDQSERFAALHHRIDLLPDHAHRLDTIDTQLGVLTDDVAALAEMAELSATTVDDTALDDLRAGQIRLAKEQTRFQISLREDVAALAEQVRRGNPTR